MADTAADIEPALMVHRMPGRLRLRFPQLRGEREAVLTLQGLLAEVPGVREVEANPRIGSVLILHDCDEIALIQHLEHLAGVSVETPQAAGDAPRHTIPALEHFLTFRQLLGGGLLLMGVVQLLRGNIATPATTAFWYALTLLSQYGPDSNQPFVPLLPED